MTVELTDPRARDASARPRARTLPLGLAVDRALPFAAGAAAAGVYIATLAPTVSILDSPELSAAAITLGVPHPTGYPLFMLLAHSWSVLLGAMVGGDPAWRLNLLTALLAGLAVGVIAAVGRRLSGRASGGWLAAGVFAFSPGFFAQANVVEVYALHIAFSATILWLWLRFEESAAAGEDPRRWLRALALTVGLSFTHHLMTVLVLPVVACSLVRHRRRWLGVGELLRLAALGIAPLGLYAYLPLVASSHPLVNWGNPRSLAAIWYHVSGAQYHHDLGGSAASLWQALRGYPAQLAHQLGAPLLPLAAVGLGVGLRDTATRPLFVALGLGWLAATAFGLSYGVVDSEPFQLNGQLVVALWMGCGAAVALRAAGARSPGASRALEALAWLAPLLALWTSFAAQDRHADYEPHDQAVAALASLPPKAVLITQGPAGYPPVYAQLVENLRPDVAVVDMYLNVRNSYGPVLDRLRQSRLPDGMTREIALTQTVAALDGGTRSLWLMPGVPDNPWSQLGLTRLRGGVLDRLVRGHPDLRVAAPPGVPLARFQDGSELLAVRADRTQVESGAMLQLACTWRLGAKPTAAGAETTVTVILADERGESPSGADGMPLLEQRRPLGGGVALSDYAAGDVIRDTASLLVPRSVAPGPWWLWVSLRQGSDWLELPDGRLFARAVRVEVTPRVRPLWTLPRD